MKIKISRALNWYFASALALCLGLQAGERADQTPITSKIENFASVAAGKLYTPQAFESTQETLAAAYDALLPYFEKIGNLAETQVQRVVDNVVGYPAFIGEAAREKYLQNHAEELKEASSEEKQEILDTAQGVATVGRLLSISNAFVTTVMPSALLGKWGDIAPSLLQIMSKSSLGLIISPILAAASYYLGSTGYRAYLRLVNSYKNIMEKAANGKLSQGEVQAAQAQMWQDVKVLEAESKK